MPIGIDYIQGDGSAPIEIESNEVNSLMRFSDVLNKPSKGAAHPVTPSLKYISSLTHIKPLL